MGLKVEPKTVYSELKDSEALAVDGLFEDFIANSGLSEISDDKKAEIYAAWVAVQSSGDVTAQELRDGLYAYLYDNSNCDALAESVYVAATDFFKLDNTTELYKECKQIAYPVGSVSEMSFVPASGGGVRLKSLLFVIAAIVLFVLVFKKSK